MPGSDERKEKSENMVGLREKRETEKKKVEVMLCFYKITPALMLKCQNCPWCCICVK